MKQVLTILAGLLMAAYAFAGSSGLSHEVTKNTVPGLGNDNSLQMKVKEFNDDVVTWADTVQTELTGSVSAASATFTGDVTSGGTLTATNIVLQGAGYTNQIDNGAGSLDGEQIADDTIDNDSIDWSDMTDLDTDGAVTWGNIAEGELANSTVVADDIKANEVVEKGDFTADGDFIVGTGSGTFAAESGATARTSMGVGTGDSPQFTGLTLTGNLAVGGTVTGSIVSSNATGNLTTSNLTANGAATIAGNVTLSGLTASQLVTTDGSKILSSSATVPSDSVNKAAMSAEDYGDWTAAADGTCTLDAGVVDNTAVASDAAIASSKLASDVMRSGDTVSRQLVQSSNVTMHAATVWTQTFETAYSPGTIPIVVGTYTEDPGAGNGIYTTSVASNQFTMAVQASKNFNWISVGVKP